MLQCGIVDRLLQIPSQAQLYSPEQICQTMGPISALLATSMALLYHLLQKSMRLVSQLILILSNTYQAHVEPIFEQLYCLGCLLFIMCPLSLGLGSFPADPVSQECTKFQHCLIQCRNRPVCEPESQCRVEWKKGPGTDNNVRVSERVAVDGKGRHGCRA